VNKYYCFISGLPEIRSEEYKLLYNLEEFKAILRENLEKPDFELVMLFYLKFDNNNLLAFLKNPDSRVDPRGSITPDMFAELQRQLNEQENIKDERFPEYFRKFIPAFINDQPLFPGLSWEDQLTTLYFDAAIQCGNPFVSAWFEFNLAITNIFTAMSCRNYAIDVSGAVVGSGEVADTIRQSNSKDFGIAPIFPYLDEVMRIIDEPDLLEREKKTEIVSIKRKKISLKIGKLQRNHFLMQINRNYVIMYPAWMLILQKCGIVGQCKTIRQIS